jgi:hypothetical protein
LGGLLQPFCTSLLPTKLAFSIVFFLDYFDQHFACFVAMTSLSLLKLLSLKPKVISALQHSV